ncbi:hypothetical protein KPH14_006388 [Odynerus spinipes]|uniref:Uncharacterized protein n=1 Tax=Odynerus spinipes TaxID=1348599 RepID=A0AAD9VVQ7_9HYME|nr:hypothetical protein KPH14_006388 [Odynerus spinipes]
MGHGLAETKSKRARELEIERAGDRKGVEVLARVEFVLRSRLRWFGVAVAIRCPFSRPVLVCFGNDPSTPKRSPLNRKRKPSPATPTAQQFGAASALRCTFFPDRSPTGSTTRRLPIRRNENGLRIRRKITFVKCRRSSDAGGGGGGGGGRGSDPTAAAAAAAALAGDAGGGLRGDGAGGGFSCFVCFIAIVNIYERPPEKRADRKLSRVWNAIETRLRSSVICNHDTD